MIHKTDYSVSKQHGLWKQGITPISKCKLKRLFDIFNSTEAENVVVLSVHVIYTYLYDMVT